jgi:aminoglycoside 3-N-acetyltransferase
VARSWLAGDLEKLGLERGGVAMVHCQMSALGCVVGGAETVVRALLDALGSKGTLMAYTGWQDAPPDDLGDLDEETRRNYIRAPGVRPARRTLLPRPRTDS